MYHIISNPTAGKRGNKYCLELAKSVFDEAGAEYSVYETTKPGEAQEIAKRLTENGATELVVVGGDGTLHEVLNGIVDPTVCRLGLVPAGTGNDFAEVAKIPLNASEAAKLILKGETKKTDYFTVGGTRCMNIAGMGIDVDVLDRCRKGKLKGRIKYFISLFQSVLAFKGLKVSFQKGDGKIEKNVMIAAVCNGRQFGGGMPVCPLSEIDDGKLDVVVVEYIKGLGNIVKAFSKLMKGEILGEKITEHFLCDEIVISSEHCPKQLDGEIYDELAFSVKLESGLNVYR